MTATIKATSKQTATTKPQIRVTRNSPAYWRVTFDNPPLNLMGPQFVVEFTEIMREIENDEQIRVVVFDSAVDGFFLNHSDFTVKLEELTSLPQGPAACVWRFQRGRGHARARHGFTPGDAKGT